VKVSQELPEDLAEVTFDTRDVIPLSELADSFTALDRLFAREATGSARLAVAEIRKGSIVALLTPFVPMMGPTVSMVSDAVTVGDFIKRLRDGLNAFAGIQPPSSSPTTPPPTNEVAGDLAELVKPLAGRKGSTLRLAHLKYRSKSGDRTVEIEASFSADDINRIAINAGRATTPPPILSGEADGDELQPSLYRKVVLTVQQANKGPAKDRGKTADRGVIASISKRPLPVYFAKTSDNLKERMVGQTSNPFRHKFKVDVLVAYSAGEPQSYTVIEVHGVHRPRKKKGPPDLLSGLGS
jgi:hypothetical protein